MVKRKISNDKSDFKTLREAGAVYVDKTKQLYDCLGHDTYYFLARPRRFGKSMLCSTLRELFLANRTLFKGLWIDSSSSDWQWEAHPVIHIGMASISGTSSDETHSGARFETDLRLYLMDLGKKYAVDIETSASTATMFGRLIASIHKKYDKAVVVIIDEYDKPILDLIGSRQDHSATHSLLKSFYGQLKHQEEHLRFVFITGIYKFTKTSIFSDLNNLCDLTLDPVAYDIIGYTQTELEANFSAEIDTLATRAKLSRTELLQTLKERHNGYAFGIDQLTGDVSPSVYNSYVANTLFAKNALNENIWFATGTPSFLMNQLEIRNFIPLNVDNMEILLSNLIDSCDPSKLTIETLLYFAGYVTIRSYDATRKIMQFRYPNLDVAAAMAREILPRMSNLSNLQWQKTALELREELLAANFEHVKEVINIALGGLHNKLFTEDESFYQTVLLFVLQQGGFLVDVELPTNRGYIDLVVHGPQVIFIIELKLNRTAGQGLAQIKAKKYFMGLLAAKLPIYLVGINCSSTTRSVTGIIGEKLELTA